MPGFAQLDSLQLAGELQVNPATAHSAQDRCNGIRLLVPMEKARMTGHVPDCIATRPSAALAPLWAILFFDGKTGKALRGRSISFWHCHLPDAQEDDRQTALQPAILGIYIGAFLS